MKTLNRNNHVCVNATGENLAWCVNKQKDGLTGIFDHTMHDVDDLDNIDIEYCLQRWIDDANAGEAKEIRIIAADKINDRGFFEDNEDETLWLTIGTISELGTNLEQEIEYQKEHRREKALEIIDDYIEKQEEIFEVKKGEYRDDLRFNSSIFDNAADEVIEAIKLLQYSKNLKDDDLIQ
jgi:hypothetical protein